MLSLLPPSPVLDDGLPFKGTLSAEYRLRFERRLDRDFNGAFDDGRTDILQRARLSLNWTAGPKFSGLVQYQYAHDLFWTASRNASDMAGDIFQAYADAKLPEGVLRIGRQRVDVASQRLIGAPEWGNLGRAYDGVRYQAKTWEAFAGRPGFPRLRKVRLGVVSFKTRIGTTTAVYKHDALATGSVDHLTLGQIYSRRLGSVDFEAEGALQAGSSEGRNQRAWAYHVQAGVKLGPNTAANVEFNSASGGGDSRTSRTFDHLYGTNHKFYGVMDMHGWKNVDMVAFNLTHKFNKDLEGKFRVSSSSLRDPSDAWYGPAGTANRLAGGAFRDPTGASGKDIGREVDFELTWKRTPKDTVMAGVGIYSPGTFVKNLAGSNRNQTFAYVQYQIKF